MKNYDHITSQFSVDLSDLAKRMYAAIFEATSDPELGITYLAAWHIGKILEEDTGLDCMVGSPGNGAMFDLMAFDLIESGFDCRYQLTARAWRAHYLHERQSHQG
jgi:hypothetical protein